MVDDKRQWKIIDIINTTAAYFAQKDISDPRLNAERLLSHVLNLDRIQLYLQFDRILTTEEVGRYRSLIERRIKREPLQYIIGKTEFMGLPFEVNPAVLIPRPETEILVERILALKNAYGNREVVIWEIGTGSGCIAVALAKLWPGSKIIATDIAETTLETARKNSQLNLVADKIHFQNHDVIRHKPLLNEKVDILVSNPPYVSGGEFDDLDPEIRRYEPEIALTDYEDGLVFYRRIFSLPQEGMQVSYILVELSGLNQNSIINLTKQFNYININMVKDYNNIVRVLEIKL